MIRNLKALALAVVSALATMAFFGVRASTAQGLFSTTTDRSHMDHEISCIQALDTSRPEARFATGLALEITVAGRMAQSEIQPSTATTEHLTVTDTSHTGTNCTGTDRESSTPIQITYESTQLKARLA